MTSCETCIYRSKESHGELTHNNTSAPLPPPGTKVYICHLNPPNGYWDKTTQVYATYWCSHWRESV